jgi:hypothetical protein
MYYLYISLHQLLEFLGGESWPPSVLLFEFQSSLKTRRLLELSIDAFEEYPWPRTAGNILSLLSIWNAGFGVEGLNMGTTRPYRIAVAQHAQYIMIIQNAICLHLDFCPLVSIRPSSSLPFYHIHQFHENISVGL